MAEIDVEICQVLDAHCELCDPPLTVEKSAHRKRLLNRLRVLFARQNLELIRIVERIEKIEERLDGEEENYECG